MYTLHYVVSFDIENGTIIFFQDEIGRKFDLLEFFFG